MTAFGYELIVGAVAIAAVVALAYWQSRPKQDDTNQRGEFASDFAALTAPIVEIAAPALNEPVAVAVTPARKRKPKKTAKKRRASAS